MAFGASHQIQSSRGSSLSRDVRVSERRARPVGGRCTPRPPAGRISDRPLPASEAMGIFDTSGQGSAQPWLGFLPGWALGWNAKTSTRALSCGARSVAALGRNIGRFAAPRLVTETDFRVTGGFR